MRRSGVRFPSAPPPAPRFLSPCFSQVSACAVCRLAACLWPFRRGRQSQPGAVPAAAGNGEGGATERRRKAGSGQEIVTRLGRAAKPRCRTEAGAGLRPLASIITLRSKLRHPWQMAVTLVRDGKAGGRTRTKPFGLAQIFLRTGLGALGQAVSTAAVFRGSTLRICVGRKSCTSGATLAGPQTRPTLAAMPEIEKAKKGPGEFLPRPLFFL
jgi:hypothetical protein